MTPKFHFDSRQFDLNIGKLAQAVGKEMPQLVRGEARLLMAEAIVQTRPLGRGSKAKQAQEKSIEREFKRIISPVRPASECGGPYRWHDPNLQKLIKKKNAEGLEQAFRAIGGRMGNAVVMREFDKDAHKLQRGRQSKRKVYTLDYQAWRRRLSELKKRAGFTKAGWGISYLALGGTSLPLWIRRHIGYAKGHVNLSMLESNNPAVDMYASVPGKAGVEFRATFGRAVFNRHRIMLRKIKAILNGHSFDWKNGVVRTWKPKAEPEARVG